jgi:endonuclease/exonuclease/phosphatase (EEP) superfamily protein YafD
MKRKWRGRIQAALAILAIALIILSFLPLWQTDRWWVRQWDYPRLQVAGLLLIVGAAYLLIDRARSGRTWALILGCLAALVWQSTHFIAYLPPYPKQVESAKSCAAGRQFALLNANVLMTNHDYGPLLSLIAKQDPDLILLLETDRGWERAIAGLAQRYPYRLAEAVPNTYGMILLSRLPLKGEIDHLLQPGVPSVRSRVQLADGEWIDFHGLHPEPPWPGDDSGERDAELLTAGRTVRDAGRAAIVMGDLNDVAWSRTSQLFKKVAGMGDPRVGRGFYPTFNANYPLLRWPLDHLFVSPHFELLSIDLLGDIGSDHLPIAFRLCLKSPAGERKVAPAAAAPAEAEAAEELREGRAERRQENAQ